MVFVYSVKFRKDLTRRVYRISVIAPDPDTARAYVLLREPELLAFAGYPRRGKAVIADLEVVSR